MQPSDDTTHRMRLDKWLWCARLFKSRTSAGQAISGGKIRVNGERAKPAHAVRIGDRVHLKGQGTWADFDVVALPGRRGPAAEAQQCYRESEESVQRRAEHREQLRLADAGTPRPASRPDKRDRRRLLELQRVRMSGDSS